MRAILFSIAAIGLASMAAAKSINLESCLSEVEDTFENLTAPESINKLITIYKKHYPSDRVMEFDQISPEALKQMKEVVDYDDCKDYTWRFTELYFDARCLDTLSPEEFSNLFASSKARDKADAVATCNYLIENSNSESDTDYSDNDSDWDDDDDDNE